MKDLTKINSFGNIDANLDELLEDCFEEHSAFKQLKNFERFLVIGKKGTGKTAIFKKMLQTKTFDTFCEGDNLTNYPWYLHELLSKSGIPENENFIHTWKYLLLISVSKVLLNKDQSIPFDDCSQESIDILERFIIDTYGSKNPNITHIFTPTRQFKLSSLIGGKLGNKQASLQLPFEVVDMDTLPTVIQDVNNTIMDHVMKCINPSHEYFICFDELDISFDKQSDSYFKSIIGLIRAARDFNLCARKQRKKVEICIFLRDDIYDLLKFEDKRKITQNFVTRIEWDTNRTDNTLKQLMEKRFAKLLKESENEIVTWENVFNEIKKINGKNSKYNYLLDLTCLRPRDMIDLCNNVLIEYKKRSENELKIENIFQNTDIINSKESYSSNLLEEFDDEIHKHIPEYETYLDMIKKVGKSKFKFDEFNCIYEKMKIKLKDEKDSKTIIEELFNFSIVGNYKIGGTQGGSKKLFRYKNSKEKFQEDLVIIVHPGLIQTLGLKEK